MEIIAENNLPALIQGGGGGYVVGSSGTKTSRRKMLWGYLRCLPRSKGPPPPVFLSQDGTMRDSRPLGAGPSTVLLGQKDSRLLITGPYPHSIISLLKAGEG